VGIVTFVPFIHVVFSSVTSAVQVARGGLVLIPDVVTGTVYRYIFGSASIMRSLVVSLGVAAIGTASSMLLTVLLAYPVSRKNLRYRGAIMLIVVITMYFSGGLIPTFIVVRSLRITNTFFALFLPITVNTFFLIIMKSFFEQLPTELEDSGVVDGANDLQILLRIMLPVSKPVLATVTLFYIVRYWNSFMEPLFFVTTPRLWTLQIVLRNIILSTQAASEEVTVTQYPIDPNQILSAVIVIATVPMAIVYPFLQRYFTKGIMLGAVKG
jgi:putative aldouronate transport system permease protein